MLAKDAREDWGLGKLLDFFIPKEMLQDEEQHRRARMFMMSHAFGPILGSTLPIYIYVAGIANDYRVAVFLISILLFWIYPFALRSGTRYRSLAFVSIQNLAFCVIWACYSFGGVLSPFVPWLLIIPLLAFLYLPPVGTTRQLLLLQIYANLLVFAYLTTGNVTLPAVDLRDLQGIGIISNIALAIYFSMMALYFGSMLREQREFERKLHDLVASSGNIRNLTQAAHQASAAKSGFIAGMSHELRTPLNAIIGYSQLLLEEAEDEGDKESVADLGNIHRSGADLLYLIDQILDFSRIEAGKMPSNPMPGSFDQVIRRLVLQSSDAFSRGEIHHTALGGEHSTMVLDWIAVGAIIQNLAAYAATNDPGSYLNAGMLKQGDKCLLVLEQVNSAGHSSPIDLDRDLFKDTFDETPTKYGSMGIEIAIVQKYIQMLGAEARQVRRGADTFLTEISIPASGSLEERSLAA